VGIARSGDGCWLGGRTLSVDKRSALGCLFGKREGSMQDVGFGEHVDNFIRWRLRSDIAESKGHFGRTIVADTRSLAATTSENYIMSQLGNKRI